MSQNTDYWNDAALSGRIDADIEQHRKNDAQIRVTDAEGKPLPDVTLSVDQVDSSFYFGANIFMLGCYPTPEENRRYEKVFCNLFNAATVPFYWRGLEPEQGKPRFAAESSFFARRPPPDEVVAFCEEHGLRMHGHPLVWNFVKWSVPDWLSDDPAINGPLWDERIRQIGERYGHRIHRWDAVNEVAPERHYPEVRGVPANYERLAFSWSEKHLPKEARLDINELTSAWDHLLPAYEALIQRLIDDGARVGGIGLQFHLFHDSELRALMAGEIYQPARLLDVLDTLAAFRLPLHISEITLTSPDDTEEGRAMQAQAARALYRLWFSHPAVDSITWWNVPDGGAAPGEDKVYSGLVTRNHEPKPAYTALHDLLHKEWRTHLGGTTAKDGTFAFRGFHGNYEATVRRNGTETKVPFQVTPGAPNEIRLTL